LLNWNQWPRRTPRKSIEEQTAQFLRARGVSEEDIAIAFEPEERGDPYFNARPRPSARARTDSPDIAPVEVEMLTPEARKRFQLFADPFVNDVTGPEDVFLAADQRYIREAMYHTARHGGFLAVIGESGSGKSTLRRDLIERVKNEDIVVIQPRVIDKRALTAGMICDAIICDVSKETPRMRLEAKARQVERLLTGSAQAGASHVLIIEEAHDLTVPALKHLKRFWELEHGFKKLLAIILIGQPELRGLLDERQNYAAREVIRRCEIAQLEPLDGNLEDYLALKFRRVGKQLDEIFAKDAYDAIRARLTDRRRGPGGVDHVLSQLYPLVVNRLVTRALNEAAEIGAPRIDRALIEAL
ncbi:MAG TPA: AAA family ATPase, partial [Burkholderiales bacterium]|nr:AAA family ATPase [Burkholderiales bacterium]